MATFTLTIDTDNAAFGEDGRPTAEIKRILKRLVVSDTLNDLSTSDKRYGANEGKLRDGNGNTVGTFQLTDD